MREPTSIEAQYRWHREKLLGLEPDGGDVVQCGWFKRRLVKGGPFVPARIWLTQEIDAETGELVADELLQCEVAGDYRDPEQEWGWLNGYPIPEAEFNYLTELRRWSTWHAPDEPMANPRQPIDWLKVPTPEF